LTTNVEHARSHAKLPEMITLQCGCGKWFDLRKRDHKSRLKNGAATFSCSRACGYINRPASRRADSN
jgi:hypothetical protein